jgi:lipoate-protein ligase A
LLLLDTTFDDPAENLAFDEAMLASTADGLLRIWEPHRPMVVLGRSSRPQEEVDFNACRAAGATVLRRMSGGATIVAAPGCLMYAVALDLAAPGAPRGVEGAHHEVLGRLARALGERGAPVARHGTSDLALPSPAGPLKCSGNSLRITRSRLVYHGTLLYAMDLGLVDRLLRHPPREPDYRNRRPHGQFLANLPLPRAAVIDAVRDAFGAEPAPASLGATLADHARRLATTNYIALD